MDRNNIHHNYHLSTLEVFDRKQINNNQITWNSLQAMSWSEYS